MKYSIEGDTLPVVICELEQGEVMVSENGDRSWMLGDIVTETTTGGGAKKMLGRMFSGESMFLSRYKANSAGKIAFASSFPGSIVAKELGAGESIVAQKSAFLAATEGVELSVFFQKKVSLRLLIRKVLIQVKLRKNVVKVKRLHATFLKWQAMKSQLFVLSLVKAEVVVP